MISYFAGNLCEFEELISKRMSCLTFVPLKKGIGLGICPWLTCLLCGVGSVLLIIRVVPLLVAIGMASLDSICLSHMMSLVAKGDNKS